MRTLASALGMTLGLSLACAIAPAFAQQSDPKPTAPKKTDPLDALDVPDLKLYRAGSLLLHKGDHAAAIACFAELLEKHPKSRWASEARFWRASAMEESGQRAAALAAYRALSKLSPKSGWGRDAVRRIQRLSRKSSRLALLKCTVQLKEGKPFVGQLHELTSEGVLLSGGPFTSPERVKFARLVRLEVEGGGPNLVIMSNGDRFSGRLLTADPNELVIEVPGIERPLRVPAARLLELRAPGRVSTAWVGTGYGTDVYGLPRRVPSGARMGAFTLVDVERETRVNPDGSRTTTTIDGLGRKTVTTVIREGKGRKVMIQRGEGAQGALIELKIDGGAAGEALLGELAGELPEGLAEQLGDVDLDLDFEIDDAELSDLDEALRELPRDLRERIRWSLHEQRRKRAKRQKSRRVWVQRGRGGDEQVIILEDEHAPKARRVKRIRKKVVVIDGKDGRTRKHVVIVERDGHERKMLFDPIPHDRVRNTFAFSSKTRGGLTHDFTLPSKGLYEFIHEEPQHDRVFLRNGDTLSGKIRSLDAEGLKLDTDYGKVTIRRDQVRQVLFAKPAVAFLGITMKATSKGVEVADVHAGSAAAAAGVKKGDVIVQVTRTPHSSSETLTVEALGAEVKRLGVGGTITLVVQRGKTILVLKARLLKRPRRVSSATYAPPTADLLQSKRGSSPQRHIPWSEHLRKAAEDQARDRDNTTRRLAAKKVRAAAGALRRAESELSKAEAHRREALEQLKTFERAPSGKPRLGVALSDAGGKITINQVMAGSLAERVGLKSGDRIVELQGKPVKSISDVAKALKDATQIQLRVERGSVGQIQVLELKFKFGN
ncbi:MAG: PDZ domain-containing protein [Planctomycetes bacterium]|nr:PDZ domain-containing protein [Planctomycetota bacterium]